MWMEGLAGSLVWHFSILTPPLRVDAGDINPFRLTVLAIISALMSTLFRLGDRDYERATLCYLGVHAPLLLRHTR